MNADASAAFDLEVESVVKKFAAFTAVDEVSFTVPKGSFFSILGPSGCGKTTLMRMIAGFLEPTSGDLRIKGRSMLGVPPNRRPVNMVFQHLALFPMMSVAENVAYGLRRRGAGRAEIEEKVAAMLARVGLPDAGEKRIDQLSGGQKQRIAIARCLVLEPDLLLLDEPLGALDLKLREQMKVELKQLQADVGTTFVYITHDQSEALVMSDQVAVMNAGRFEQVGNPQALYYRPETAFVAGFVGDSNRWIGAAVAVDGRGIKLATDDGLVLYGIAAGRGQVQSGGSLDVFVRPESIAISRSGKDMESWHNRVQGKVKNLLFNGANSRAVVIDDKTGFELIVALPQTGEFADLQRGETVHLGWSAEQTLCFVHDGAAEAA